MNKNQHNRALRTLIPLLTVIASGLLAVTNYGQFNFDPTSSVNAGPSPGGCAVGDTLPSEAQAAISSIMSRAGADPHNS